MSVFFALLDRKLSIVCVSYLYYEIFNFEILSRQTQKDDFQTFKEALLAAGIVCFCDERIPFELFLHKVEICFVSFVITLFVSRTECSRYLKKGTFKFA